MLAPQIVDLWPTDRVTLWSWNPPFGSWIWNFKSLMIMKLGGGGRGSVGAAKTAPKRTAEAIAKKRIVVDGECLRLTQQSFDT